MKKFMTAVNNSNEGTLQEIPYGLLLKQCKKNKYIKSYGR